MTKTKITSEDIFNRIKEIEEGIHTIPLGQDFLGLQSEKDRILLIYASLRIAEALEQNSTRTHNNLNLPVVTTEKISGEKETKPSSLSAYSGNPSPLPGEKHRKNWEEILHQGELEGATFNPEDYWTKEEVLQKEKPSEKSPAEHFKEEGERQEKLRAISAQNFSGERQTLKKFDLDKINKVAHLLADRGKLLEKPFRTEEEEKTLDTLNSYLETYGLKDVDENGSLHFFEGEMNPLEKKLAFAFGSYLHDPNYAAIQFQQLKDYGLNPVKEKIGEEEIENLAYLPEEKTEKE